MKIQKLTIENFRSITKAYEVTFDDLTVLIGPNNEGKSNILYALSLAVKGFFDFLPPQFRRLKSNFRESVRQMPAVDYNWNRDFPVQLQNPLTADSEESQKEKKTIFVLYFNLSSEEVTLFKQKTGYELKNNFGIQIIKQNVTPFSEILPLDGKETIKELDNIKGFQKIANFLNETWDFQYIPTIRTAQLAAEIVAQIIERELAGLDEKEAYRKLISRIENYQNKILQKLASKLTKDMGKYLSNVKKIKISTSNQVRRLVRQAAQIFVDDGVETPIDLKGDGVKSMLAISILHNSVQRKDRSLCLAIEEPESHLHPLAIRRLKEVIKEMAQKNQIIITTHSPLFVDRINYQNNIIVRGSVAEPAKSVQEVRDCLGVAIQDNLQSAAMILLVEGESDAKILKSFLSNEPVIASALENGYFQLVPLNGASTLSFQIKMYEEALCEVCAFLDYDDEALRAFKKAKEQNLISSKSVFFTRQSGYQESEMEDLINPRCYKDKLETDYAISGVSQLLRRTRLKWSERMKNVFESNGKLWDDNEKKKVKHLVADFAVANGVEVLTGKGKTLTNSFKKFLERKLKK
jgi:predicted ATP-dependent endonuclease of OLD family